VTADVWLVLRHGQPDETVEGTFLAVTLRLGVHLRPIVEGIEWASVDGDLSLIRYADAPLPVGALS